jgi:hypothetical protein
VDFVSLDGSRVRVDAGKRHVLTEVVSSIIAEEAVLARYTRLDSDAIACK